MDGFTALDIMVLLALAGGAVTGALRGFVQEILSLGALILALFVLRLFHAPLSIWLTEAVGTEAGASVLAFSLIMGVIWGGGKFAARRIGGVSRNSLVGPFDRVLGAGFGMLKALLIAATAFMLISLLYDLVYGAREARPDWMTDSRTYPLLSATSVALSDIIAERLDDTPTDMSATPPSAPAP